MIITETVVIGFEPVTERESMEKFEREHDMNGRKMRAQSCSPIHESRPGG